MNIAFYVSSTAGRLNKIINDNKTIFMNDVKVVFSDDEKNSYLKYKLEKLNIQYILCDYKALEAEKGKKNLELSNKLFEVLRQYQIDYCFSFGGHILKGDLLDIYENRIINFHPSLLPAYPGTNSINQAIKDKANLLGNTAHFIDAGMDTGPIIMQSVIPLAAFYEGGYDAILDIQIEMLYKIYYLLQAGRIKINNSKVIIEGANYSLNYILPFVEM